MADIETLGIIDEIQALVSDKLQVVSYKWLSRNFLVPSDTAKRLLQEFVEKNGSQLEVIYSLSGWLKNNPEAYHVKLVLGAKLSEAKEEFNDGCSVQVYSIQACVPKDPAVLWNAEFVQSEELFKEPPNVVNCLRDNRFCGVSNPFVKRNVEGTPVNSAGPQLKNVVTHGQSRINQTSLGKEKKIEQSDAKPNQGVNIQSGSHKEQVPQNKKKTQNDKVSSGTSSSLASMWGRASAKPKPESASVKTDTVAPISNDAQVRANESVEDESSDDQQMNFKRASNGEGNNRKRRVVLDFSDEDDNVEDAVNLASPDPPKKQVAALDSKKSCSISGLENKNLDFDEQKEVKNEKATETDPKSLTENKRSHENDVKQEDKTSNAVKNGTKKRKVLKTRIDERGREVTEVVWEDDEKETRPDDNTRKDKDDNKTASNIAVNRPAAAAAAPKKSPAVGNAPSHATGKAGNKKTNAKDPKQGNIMSFFKKVLTTQRYDHQFGCKGKKRGLKITYFIITNCHIRFMNNHSYTV
ncbi:putative DNA polymerase delta subunit 3 [Helianthus annuus]|nr:putative DNA polymerase delta subunit 3 [Helianthus annuus]